MPLSSDPEATDDRCEDAIDAFFRRNGFASSTRQKCDEFAQLRFREVSRVAASHQGYCSYTIILSDSHLLQFRPEAFKLDLRICEQAKVMFPDLVPSASYLSHLRDEPQTGVLHAYLLERSRGITLTQFRKNQKTREAEVARMGRRRLVQDLASVFATSYIHRRYPTANEHDWKGNVGKSLRRRLDIMTGLPFLYTEHVDAIRRRIDLLEEHGPWCLTHGDLVPDNIMVDPNTGHLTGLIDWAEGEWLPSGVGLYGLEEVLGEDRLDGHGFAFYPEQDDLRKLFWKFFINEVRPTRILLSRSRMADLELGRQLGILLWRGIAFDDGKLDRVVDKEKDPEELRKLGLFLGAVGPHDTLDWWRVNVVASMLRRVFRPVFRPCLPRGAYNEDEKDVSVVRQGLDSVSSATSDKSRGESWREGN